MIAQKMMPPKNYEHFWWAIFVLTLLVNWYGASRRTYIHIAFIHDNADVLCARQMRKDDHDD